MPTRVFALLDTFLILLATHLGDLLLRCFSGTHADVSAVKRGLLEHQQELISRQNEICANGKTGGVSSVEAFHVLPSGNVMMAYRERKMFPWLRRRRSASGKTEVY